jgi:hypothetical protein
MGCQVDYCGIVDSSFIYFERYFVPNVFSGRNLIPEPVKQCDTIAITVALI